jgi:hypothetical protein
MCSPVQSQSDASAGEPIAAESSPPEHGQVRRTIQVRMSNQADEAILLRLVSVLHSRHVEISAMQYRKETDESQVWVTFSCRNVNIETIVKLMARVIHVTSVTET